jgi:hypothetical protein
MSVVILRNIASDAATILETETGDGRRSKPFHRLAENPDPTQLRAKLRQQAHDLRDKNANAAIR